MCRAGSRGRRGEEGCLPAAARRPGGADFVPFDRMPRGAPPFQVLLPVGFPALFYFVSVIPLFRCISWCFWAPRGRRHTSIQHRSCDTSRRTQTRGVCSLCTSSSPMRTGPSSLRTSTHLDQGGHPKDGLPRSKVEWDSMFSGGPNHPILWRFHCHRQKCIAASLSTSRPGFWGISNRLCYKEGVHRGGGGCTLLRAVQELNWT